MTLSVEVQRTVRKWAPTRSDIATWAGTALGRKAAGRELGVRVVGPAESRRLNARYRGRTNLRMCCHSRRSSCRLGPSARWVIW